VTRTWLATSTLLSTLDSGAAGGSTRKPGGSPKMMATSQCPATHQRHIDPETEHSASDLQNPENYRGIDLVRRAFATEVEGVGTPTRHNPRLGISRVIPTSESHGIMDGIPRDSR